MGLTSALQIGRSALLAHQAAIEVAGNNLANAATVGYHRQTIALAPAGNNDIGNNISIGRGVQIQNIIRQTSEALEGRVRGAIADQSASAQTHDILAQIEALQNELTDTDLSSHLGAFFNAWSELANTPLDNSLRTLVTQQGKTLASFIQDLRTELVNLRDQVDHTIDESAATANDLLTQIAAINRQIAASERGQGSAGSLRDQRDLLLADLSQFVDISIVEQPTGSVDVFVGSIPVILNGQSRGIEVRRDTLNGELNISVVISADGSVLQPTSGKLGSLFASRQNDVNPAIEFLDTFANQLVFEVNKVHSQSQGKEGFADISGTSRVLNTGVALSSDAAGLDFTPTHGSFQVTLTQKSTGQRSTATINVDLDGIDPGSDTSLTSLVASLNGVTNLSASITPDGRLRITTVGNDFEVSFGQDSSGALAALGVNTFFQGSDASDIAVNAVVAASPGKLAAGQGNVLGDNRAALAIAGLRSQNVAAFNGLSITEAWNRHVEDYAVRLGQSNQQLQASGVVRENLAAQQQAIGGVNIDEESINLLASQRAFQASARFLSVVDEMMDTLLSMV